ncbi:MAG: cobalt-precorrin-5B (C(1))-methyltransferase [Pseudomonadota bacterium]
MKQNKNLQTGYTTGTCAAAAAKGALLHLLGKQFEALELLLPGGESAALKPSTAGFDRDGAFCDIVKDAGDDADVTHGAVIRATVALTANPGIVIRGGEGVGVVTRPGLAVPPGEPAINPVPRKMIHDALFELLPPQKGADVTVSVPGGQALAKKTFNPRLGITGGISILGTTGIVVPYSHEAFRESIVCALDVAQAAGLATAVLSTGKTSEKTAQRYYRDLPPPAFILMGDYFLFAVQEAARHGIKKIIISCYPGKLLKMAAGADCTHVNTSAIDLHFLGHSAAKLGMHPDGVKLLSQANTVRHAFAGISETDKKNICNYLSKLVMKSVRQAATEMVIPEVLVISYDDDVLLKVT